MEIRNPVVARERDKKREERRETTNSDLVLRGSGWEADVLLEPGAVWDITDRL